MISENSLDQGVHSRVSRLLLLAAAILAIAVFVVAGIAISKLQGTELWTSLTAIGTLGAVLMSTLFSVSTLVGEYLRENQRKRNQHSLEVRGQAEQVWWWTEECSEHDSLFSDRHLSGKKPGLDECWGECLILENRSEYPISSVRIISSNYLVPFIEDAFFKSLGPKSKRTYHLVSEACSLIYIPTHPGTRVTFQDRHEQMWQREQSGAPSMITTSAHELEKLADAVEREQRQAIWEARQFDWVDGIETELRIALKSRTFSEHIERLDDLMFRVLQELPWRHWKRRVAEQWWRWRAGKAPRPSSLYE